MNKPRASLRNQRLRPGHQGATDRRGGRPRATPGVFSLANAKQRYERYVALAKEALRAGDRVEMENCYQHAEHYFRMMRDPEQR